MLCRVSDYLSAWALGFNTAGHGTSNTGGFSNGTLAGDQYATHGANSSDYAFIADSDTSNGLHYVFNPLLPASSNQNHFLWGELDNVQLGTGLGGGSGSDFSLSDFKVAFNGLDLSAAVGCRPRGNEVQSVIYGLMQGNTSALETVLTTCWALSASLNQHLRRDLRRCRQPCRILGHHRRCAGGCARRGTGLGTRRLSRLLHEKSEWKIALPFAA